ncbi:glycoside hydrolase family 26 protein [Planosporangium mesophilum]|uniref:GH26 domain-containing protein n=1 Tax=Planosporangium mesophilum TaxID=689768 RepID=A0A8J3TC57_9ACTN|nr:glycosyl hydrolase [Planosporangium mesophilum]NJC84915.1 beta-mannanase [Planosporangium mesophilum]GII23619.1 hypothetical protein Pme01_32160 [Planosporangium mesophilum]
MVKKPTGPGLTFALVAAALVSYTFVLAPKLGLASQATSTTASPVPSARASTSGAPTVFPPRDKSFIGVTTADGTVDLASVDAFKTATRHRPAVMMFSQGWSGTDSDGATSDKTAFDKTAFDKIAQQGALPMLSWEPWNRRDDVTARDAAQPQYRLSRIASGAFDDYIRSYARGVKSLDYRVAIRLAHEMNGPRYPWGANVNGNQPGDYVKMWRHVHDVFAEEDVDNVVWVWSATAGVESRTRLSALYPGDDYVDWVGLSGYYGTTSSGTTGSGTAGAPGYRSPDSIFDAALIDLHTFAGRPVVITETAATDTAGLKARWVRDLFQYLPKHADVIGFIWCEAVRETDWRIASSQAAATAFAELAADPRYAVTWAPDLEPRTSLVGPTPVQAAPSATQAASPPPSRTVAPRPTPGRTRPPSHTPTTTPPVDPTPTRTASPPHDPTPEPTPSP